MFCSECGAQVPDDSLFCLECGAKTANAAPLAPPPAVSPQTAPVMNPPFVPAGPAAGKPRGRKPPVLIIVAAAVVLLVAAGVILALTGVFAGGGGQDRYQYENRPLITYGDGYMLICNGQEPVRIEGDNSPGDIQYSMDGQHFCALVYTDDEDWTRQLWYYDGKVAVMVAEDIQAAWISENGERVYYTTGYDEASSESASTGDLFCYVGSKGQSEPIDEDVMATYVCLSPDGRSVAYMKDFAVDGSSFTGYYRADGGEVQETGENKVAVAIANQGKILFLYEFKDAAESTEYNLIALQGGEEAKVSTFTYNPTLLFNAGRTEVLYAKDNGATYLYNVKDDESTKLSSGTFDWPLMPNGAQYIYNSTLDVASIPVSSFVGSLFRSDDYTAVHLLTADLELDKITSVKDDWYSISLAVNGRTLAFVDARGDLARYMNITDQKAEPEEYDPRESVETLYMTPDGSTIYYLDIESTLWRIGKDGESEKIDTDVYTVQLAPDSKGLYYLADYESVDTYVSDDDLDCGGTLYYIRNAAGAEKSKLADNAYQFQVSADGLMYTEVTSFESLYSEFTGSVYYSRDGGKSFTAVISDEVLKSIY